MCNDPYTYSQIVTIGGGTGSYIIESPFSGEEYEYSVLGISTGSVTGTYQAVIATDQAPPAVAYDGSVAYGSLSAAPYTFLKALTITSTQNTSLFPAAAWARTPNGNKYVYIRTVTPAASAVFISLQFRFLPVRVIPARAVTVPDVAEHQYNLAREDKVIERLEMDVAKGDRGGVSYGRLS